MPSRWDKTRELPWLDELKDMWDKRDPHVQEYLAPLFPQRPEFPGTQFIGYIVKDIKSRANGEIEVTFTAPFEFADEVLQLHKALTVPLSIDVQLWKPYEEALNGGSGLAEPATSGNGKEAAE